MMPDPNTATLRMVLFIVDICSWLFGAGIAAANEQRSIVKLYRKFYSLQSAG